MKNRKYRIKVRYIGGYVQNISGKSYEEINISSSEDVTIQDLLKYLSDKYGDRFIYHIYDAHNNLRNQTIIFLNGNIIDSTKLKVKLTPNSEVRLAFIPIFAGG